MALITMIDPPSGWKYGFPRPDDWDPDSGETRTEWFVRHGYPRELAENIPYCRYWEQEEESEK